MVDDPDAEFVSVVEAELARNVVTGHFGGMPYRHCQNLQEEIEVIVNQYRGKTSKAEVIGVLQTIVMNIHNED